MSAAVGPDLLNQSQQQGRSQSVPTSQREQSHRVGTTEALEEGNTLVGS